MDTVNVAIAGATGAVGEVMREILEEREFPVDKLSLLPVSGQREPGFSMREVPLRLRISTNLIFRILRLRCSQRAGLYLPNTRQRPLLKVVL